MTILSAVQANITTLEVDAIVNAANYGYPIESAASVAIATVRGCTQEPGCVQEVIFCCFSASDLAQYTSLLQPFSSSQ